MRPVVFSYKIFRKTPCPIISFAIKGPKKWFGIEAYVDSGAFISIFAYKDAFRIGINPEKGRKIFVTVGDGGSIPVYLHKLDVKIGNIPFKATIGFSARLGVGFNLLGRKDIFTHFDVTFSDRKTTIIFNPKFTASKKLLSL